MKSMQKKRKLYLYFQKIMKFNYGMLLAKKKRIVAIWLVEINLNILEIYTVFFQFINNNLLWLRRKFSFYVSVNHDVESVKILSTHLYYVNLR